MTDRLVLDRTTTPRGELALVRAADGALEIVSNGVFLMDTRDGRSEELLVDAALYACAIPSRVLIGGLGVGFSLRAALRDQRVGRLDVAEIEPTVVGWHRGPLAELDAGLDDPRVQVHVTDVAELLLPATYDVICLDVDNGPGWTVNDTNTSLYDDSGLVRLAAALRPGGVLAVWSAASDPAFAERLRQHVGPVAAHEVAVARGEPDVVYVAVRAAD